MHDGGNYYDSSYNGTVREAGQRYHPKGHYSSTGVPQHRYPGPPPPPPCPPIPTKQLDDKDILALFVSTMTEHFADHDLTYCFKEEKFNNPKTNDMFKIWKLARNHHG